MNNDFGFNNFDQFKFSGNSYWNKYDSVINKMSNEQKNFVSKQKSVLQAKQNLMTAFIDYLFEANKNNFVMTCDTAKNLADDYITAIEKAATSYVTRQEELEKENLELKKQIQQLLDFGDEKIGKNKTTAK